MEKIKQNDLISVDSETGFYWNGERVVRHKTLIKAIIEQETKKQRADHGRAAQRFTARPVPR